MFRSKFSIALLLSTSLSLLSNAALAQTSVQLDEIIVTGERQETTLKNTGSSVVVTTGATLDAFAGPDTLERIYQQTANVTSSGADGQGPTIRGSNTSGILTSVESFFGGALPRTTIQVDGRQLSFNEFVYASASAWDIKRVEIFRGPQTTTQGRNAISGAIFVETNDPNFEEFEGRVRAIVGDDATRQGSGVISGPIGNGDVAFRLSADYREQDTFIEPLGVTNDFGADSLTKTESLSLRGKLGIRPSSMPGLDVLLTVSHSDREGPQSETLDAPFENLTRFNPTFAVFGTDATAGIANIKYDLNDTISFQNVFTISDGNATRLAPAGSGEATISSDEVSNEFLVKLNTDRLTGLAGVYVSAIDNDDAINLAGFGIGSGSFEGDRDSLGLFVEGTYGITDRLFLTAGGRYQKDSQTRTGGFTIIPINFDDTFDAFLPKAELAYDVTDNVRIGLQTEKGFNAGGFTFNFETFQQDVFEEETLWNYEAFLRGDFLGGRLGVNANVFYTDFKDIQLSTLVELGPDFFANVFSNAPEARAIGGEVDVRFQATKTLRLNAGLGLTDTEIESNTTAGALTTGHEFQRAPGLTAIAGAVWNPIEPVELSAFARYSDGYFSDDANLDANAVDSYFTMDLQASYTIGQARFFIDATNVFDEFYAVNVFSEGASGTIGDLRRVSVGLDYRF
ncbi:TonB-dependent receptor [Algimonas ampicilliniresistens]|uniref:TonB-dependent receptor n=1 Tax=Algimonas ampicilliniresistens TaxID=1298735 RepID=A0ABQ5VBL4_9PROT|nr:TonB-dependent receptor [Algimonas ampicilliniresistens]GLQ23782.1 TonB-dependent receptor [Algimonas ampicilliniresistens]